jgi:hypothetical protein
MDFAGGQIVVGGLQRCHKCMGPVRKGLVERRLEVVEGSVIVRQHRRTKDIDETITGG